MLSLRLIFTVFCAVIIGINVSYSETISNVFDLDFPNTGTTPNVWKKYIGQTVPANTPDLIDYSYAGYKNGREGIPDVSGTIIDVTDSAYGAIPSDGRSDTIAIHKAFRAASSGNVIIYFPAGEYDIFMDGESTPSYVINGNNTVIIPN